MNELFVVVVLINMIQGSAVVGTATGFFYINNGALYLVTNRHVVIDETKGLKPDLLRIRLHADPNDLTKNVERDIPLYVAGTPRWHVHPDYATTPIDVAVVQLDANAITTGTFFKALSSANFLPDNFLINPGEDVMVIGFPRGISDSAHNLPLIRGALVSSAYGIDFNKSPMFLVDANLHPGMSGSPVLTRAKNVWPDKAGNTNMMTGSPVYFLGVFSATLSVKVAPMQDEALGLGAAWYGRAIEEIIKGIR